MKTEMKRHCRFLHLSEASMQNTDYLISWEHDDGDAAAVLKSSHTITSAMNGANGTCVGNFK